MSSMKGVSDNALELSNHIRGCYMRGCLGRGYWTPVLALSPDGLQYAYMNFGNWLMCDYHKDTIGLDDLIDGPVAGGLNAFTLIQTAFAKRDVKAHIPEREFTKLLWREA